MTQESNTSTTNNTCCSNPGCGATKTPVMRQTPKVGRNDPCPCGSEVKYKKCCGK